MGVFLNFLGLIMKFYSLILILCMTCLTNGREIYECNKPNVIALTFDDGPRWDYENILDILRLNNIKATFFNLGELLNNDISLTQRAYREGHNIASHSWSHPSLVQLNEDGKLFSLNNY